MTLAELLETLNAQDVRLSLRLVANAPDGVITTELRTALTDHKPSLLARLGREALWADLRSERWGPAIDDDLPGIVIQIPGIPGRLHHISSPEQHFLQIVVIPCGSQSLVLHADLCSRLVLQQAQCCAAKDAEVGVGPPLPGPAMIFPERHVQLPVKSILDPPVGTSRSPE